MPTKVLRHLYHACWYIVAAIVLVAAVTVTLIRLGLPHINDYRTDILAWASEYSGYSIDAKKIDASWQGWTPFLNFHDITVRDSTGARVLTTLETVRLNVNPLASLVHRELLPLNIIISGPSLVIMREQDGSLHITDDNEFKSASLQDQQSGFLTNWLLQQRTISIEDATIEYVDDNLLDKSVILTNVDLGFRKSFERMQINVSAGLPEEYGESLSLRLDALGDITTPDWSGEIYADASNIYPDMFLSMYRDKTPDLIFNSSPANIKLWSRWRNGRLNSVEGMVNTTDIEIAYQGSTFNIIRLDTSFSGIRNKSEGMDLNLAVTNLVTANGQWPQTSIEITRQTDINGDNERYLARIDYLKLDDVYPLLAGLFDTNNKLPESGNLSLHGSLGNTFLIYEPEATSPLYIKSDIDYLTINEDEKTVITGRGGHINGDIEYGTVSLDSASLEISLPDYFANTISFYELTGDITWQQSGEGLVFRSRYLESHTTDFNIHTKGNVIFTPGNNAPVLDLIVSANNVNLEHVIRYLPLTVPEEVHEWMSHALVSGEIPGLAAVIRGALDQFPFDKNEGQFKLIANIQNAILDYDKAWIPVDRLDADLEIDNARLQVSAHTGYIYNAEIIAANAIIDDLRTDESIIRIAGNVKGTTDDALFIINNSPLSDSGMLREIKDHDIKGPLSLDLSMDIPLDHRPLSLNGDLSFDKVRLESPDYGINLENITGNILFTRDSVKTNKLTADYFNQQVDLGINTDNESNLVLSLEGSADADFITGQLAYFFPKLEKTASNLNKYIKGAGHWMASLSPVQSTGEGSNSNGKLLTIKSTLSGLSLDLPSPLKKNYEPSILNITTEISGNTEKHIDFRYGDNLAGNIILQQEGTPGLVSAEIALGPNEILSGSGEGIHIHGQTDSLSLSDWHNFITGFGTNQMNLAGNDIKVNLNISSLDFFDQMFENTNFKLTNINSDWQIDLRGNDVEGGINIPADTTLQPVKAYFSKLHFRDNQDQAESNQDMVIDPRSLPSVYLEADEFIYDAYNLGKLVLDTTNTNNGLKVNSISFTKPELSITGNGTWEYINNQEFSNFNVQLDAVKLDAMLATFDYNVSPVRDGATTLSMNALWNGSPMDFSLANITGELDMTIEKGRVLEIEPAAGRLFGLLSLQTLPRRLSLDFTDLFSKGFAFDQISGTFTIEGGNAYTNNLSMTGPSANINITGRTGLIVKDYDQVVTITPQVTSSLPVASALFGPIGVGVGAVIFLAGELFESIPRNIDRLLSYQYTISGSWDEPVVEKYGSKADPSG